MNYFQKKTTFDIQKSNFTTFINLFFFVSLIYIFSACCKGEIPPDIQFTDTQAIDTNYIVSPVPSVETKNVLIEESTGARCTNCPTATRLLHLQDSLSGHRLVMVAIHDGGQTLNIPYAGSPDLRPADHSYINYLGGVPFQPSASIDRNFLSSSNTFFNDKNLWGNQITTSLATPSPINLSITSFTDSFLNAFVIDVKATYTSDQSNTDDDYLSLLLVENDIEGEQLDGSNILQGYIWEHVYRQFITPISGTLLSKSGISRVAGRVFYQRFIIDKTTLNSSWNQSHMDIVGFVSKNNNNNKVVLQAQKTKLQ